MDIKEVQKQLSNTLNALKAQCSTSEKIMINDIQNAMKKGNIDKLNSIKSKLEANVASNRA
jgi:hypothetical protein